MGKYNFAIIGCGRISYKHIEAIVNNNDRANLVALCDVETKKAEKILEHYNALIVNETSQRMSSYEKDIALTIDNKDSQIDIGNSYELVLNNKDIDIVVIATESGSHAKITKDCLKAGKHVIVEKPMALSTKDADEMIDIAKKNDLILCVSHQNRFNATVQKLRKAVEEGRFGKIYAATARILWNRNQDYYKQAPWRGTYKYDGGCLMNQCIHNIDLLQWMVGDEIEEVHGVMNNFIHPYIEAEDYGSIQVLFKNGAIGNIEGTVNIYPHNLEETLSIFGEKGTVVIGGKALNEVQVWDFEDNKDTLEEIRKECNTEIDNVYGNGHTPLYSDFINSIEEDTTPLIDGREGKRAMSIILHAYLSNKQKERIKFGKQDIKISNYGVELI